MQKQSGKSRGLSNPLQGSSTEETLAFKKPQASQENILMLSETRQGNARDFDSSEESDDKGNSSFSQMQNPTTEKKQGSFFSPDYLQSSYSIISISRELVRSQMNPYNQSRGSFNCLKLNNCKHLVSLAFKISLELRKGLQEQPQLINMSKRDYQRQEAGKVALISKRRRGGCPHNNDLRIYRIGVPLIRLREGHQGNNKSNEALLPEGHTIDKVITRQKKRSNLNSRGNNIDKKTQKSASLQQLLMHQRTSQADLHSNQNTQHKEGQKINQMKKQYSKEDIGHPLDFEASSSRIKKKPTIMLPQIRAKVLSQSPKKQTALVNPKSLVPLSPHTMEPIAEEQTSQQFVAQEQAMPEVDQFKSSALQKQPKHQYMSKIPDKNSQTGDQISTHKLRRESSTLPQLQPNQGTKNVVSHSKDPETKQQYQINLKQANQQIVKLRRELSVKNAQLSQILKGYGTNTSNLNNWNFLR